MLPYESIITLLKFKVLWPDTVVVGEIYTLWLVARSLNKVSNKH